MFATLIEDEATEAARMAQSPVGSEPHFLSTFPVTIHEYVRGLIIRIPSQFPENGDITVVPVEDRSTPRERAEGEKLRRDGVWNCIVVHSTDKSYPVGGYDIVVHEQRLRRGVRITELS